MRAQPAPTANASKLRDAVRRQRGARAKARRLRWPRVAALAATPACPPGNPRSLLPSGRCRPTTSFNPSTTPPWAYRAVTPQPMRRHRPRSAGAARAVTKKPATAALRRSSLAPSALPPNRGRSSAAQSDTDSSRSPIDSTAAPARGTQVRGDLAAVSAASPKRGGEEAQPARATSNAKPMSGPKTGRTQPSWSAAAPSSSTFSWIPAASSAASPPASAS